MSSPFATFRKNRQYWMAALTLLALISFVVLPAIDTARQAFQNGSVQNVEFVSWDGGRMSQAEGEQGMAKRRQLLNLLTALSQKVVEKGGEPAVPGFSRLPNGQVSSLGIDQEVSAERVCLNRILMTKAKQMGIEFDDQAADEYLKSFMDQRITDKEFKDTLATHSTGLTVFDVRELLKQELTVRVAESLASGGQGAVSPGKTWQDFLKLTQTAKVEAYPIYVDSYTDKVTDKPTDAEIQSIYDEGKQNVAHPSSPNPGFLRLEQANLEYVESRFQDWIDREKQKLTEEEIRAEYDRLVGLGQLKMPVSPEAPAETDATAVAPEVAVPDGTTPNGTSPDSTTPPAETPASPESGGTNAPAADTPAEQAPQTSEKDTIEQSPAVEPPVETPPADAPAVDAQSSLNQMPDEADGRVRLVAFAQEPTPSSETPITQSDSEVPSDTESAAATTSDTQDSDVAVAEPTATDKPAEPPMRTKTFEEARDEVALQLARAKAIPISDGVLTQLAQMMKDYYLKYRQYQAYQNAGDSLKDKVTLPVRPDLKKFAADNQLKYGETGLVDRLRLAGERLGNSNLFMDGRSVGNVASIVTTQQIDLFSPLQSGFFATEASEFYQYSFWKTDARPAYAPDLSEVREEVGAAWVRIRARELAEAAAVELSKKIGSGEDPWKAVGDEAARALVTSTEPFTWLTRMGNGIVPTTVASLDQVGNEFMRKVFATEVDKIDVAPNNAKSVYYVFRVMEKSPDTAELRNRFQAAPTKQGPTSIANMEQSDAGRIWISQVIKDLNVKFSNN
ncbi:MAG TPA: hypothetical protein DCF63_14135 [Planctomycetaceae bacterium]|nr:hypothetical protein [Planctomycetaceae bacterium]